MDTDTTINIILLLAGFVGAVAAIGGDTWHKGEVSLLKRITKRGWLSILALSLTLYLGVIKELRTKEDQLYLFESLVEANKKLEKAQISLSSIEPDILEGMFQLTERIPREQDFAFAHIKGQLRVIPQSSDSKSPLQLYGGDVFEWHHFCRYPENADPPGDTLHPPFVLDTNIRKYPLVGKDGEVRISGPIGTALSAIIENPARVKGCGFKIVVRSTDRTRTQSQFEPLLNKIREAKKALSNSE